MQDGIDLINALATHPETARRLASKVLELLHQRDLSAGSGIRGQHRRRLSAKRNGDQAGRAARLDLVVVQQPVDAIRALFMAKPNT
jgi:hypothetical protein